LGMFAVECTDEIRYRPPDARAYLRTCATTDTLTTVPRA
jgi:hypothetical protein